MSFYETLVDLRYLVSRTRLVRRIDRLIRKKHWQEVDKHLLMFLKDWEAWADSDALRSPAGIRYSRRSGLCAAWTLYGLQEAAVLGDVLGINPFLAYWGTEMHPFGYSQYRERGKNGTQHLDPNRRAWVAKTIKELERAK